MITNLPKKIYLQVGEDVSNKSKEKIDFNDLSGVSWCTDRINKTDIVYVLQSKKKRKK